MRVPSSSTPWKLLEHSLVGIINCTSIKDRLCVISLFSLTQFCAGVLWLGIAPTSSLHLLHWAPCLEPNLHRHGNRCPKLSDMHLGQVCESHWTWGRRVCYLLPPSHWDPSGITVGCCVPWVMITASVRLYCLLNPLSPLTFSLGRPDKSPWACFSCGAWRWTTWGLPCRSPLLPLDTIRDPYRPLWVQGSKLWTPESEPRCAKRQSYAVTLGQIHAFSRPSTKLMWQPESSAHQGPQRIGRV